MERLEAGFEVNHTYRSASATSFTIRWWIGFKTKFGNEALRRSATSVGGPPSQKVPVHEGLGVAPGRWQIYLTCKQTRESFFRRHDVCRASLKYSNIWLIRYSQGWATRSFQLNTYRLRVYNGRVRCHVRTCMLR